MPNAPTTERIADVLAAWIRNRNGNSPALMRVSAGNASVYICLASRIQAQELELPEHHCIDMVIEAKKMLEALDVPRPFQVALHYEADGLLEKGDLDNVLLSTAKILHRTAEHVSAWQTIEKEVFVDETGIFECRSL